jgi:hypothetical protein
VIAWATSHVTPPATVTKSATLISAFAVSAGSDAALVEVKAIAQNDDLRWMFAHFIPRP